MLTEARKGEIALKVLKLRARQEGIRLGQHSRREIGNTAKELGISFEEAIEFTEEIAKELMTETFADKQPDKDGSQSAASPRGNRR